MGKKDNLGDQILDAVEEILESGNLEKLNSVVSDTVAKALDETRKQLEKAAASAKASAAAGARSAAPKASAGENAKAAAGRYSSVQEEVKPAQTYKVVTAPRGKFKRVGSVAGVLLQVFGGIGTGIFGGFSLLFLFGNIMFGGYWDILAVFAVLLGISAGVLYLGATKRARLKRAERYVQLMQGKAYINIADLALLTHKSEAYVRKDIKKMIERGIFPEGHLDMKEECLILGDVTYREYIRLEKSRRALAAEAEEKKRMEAANAQKEAERAAEEKARAAADKENAELDAMVKEGNECIRQLRDLNDLIEGEVISAKLFHLENLLKEIFEQIKEHPEQMPEMHKFMDYYLPTTLKLVTAYEEFDHVSVPGEEILASKREIEKTLDTINMAFEELLNKLFRARVFDVTTDAQVLKTMLAKEGLTREPVFAGRAVKDEPDVMRRELK